MKKKSQAEIVGLLVIVVLVAFIMLFVLSLLMKPKPDTTDKDQGFASAFISAMLKTSSNCTEDTDVQDLLIDCVGKPSLDSMLTCNNGTKSCPFAKSVIEQMLSRTLNEKGATYELKVTSPSGQDVIDIIFGNATRSYGISKTQPLPVPPSYDDMKITLCMGRCSYVRE